MDEKQKERIKKLYGSEEDITAYMIHSGTKMGNTTISKLKQGFVKDLD